MTKRVVDIFKKDIFKMHSVSFTNTYHIPDFGKSWNG